MTAETGKKLHKKVLPSTQRRWIVSKSLSTDSINNTVGHNCSLLPRYGNDYSPSYNEVPFCIHNHHAS